MYQSTLDDVSVKISRLSTEMLIEMLIECQLSIKGINGHSTADAFSTHDLGILYLNPWLSLLVKFVLLFQTFIDVFSDYPPSHPKYLPPSCSPSAESQ